MSKVSREDYIKPRKTETSPDGIEEMCKLVVFKDGSVAFHKPPYVPDEMGFGILEFGMILIAISTVEDIISKISDVDDPKDRLAAIAEITKKTLLRYAEGDTGEERATFVIETLDFIKTLMENKQELVQEYKKRVSELDKLLGMKSSTVFHPGTTDLH